MKTITLSVTPEEKRFIKSQAALNDITMKHLILSAVGWKNTFHSCDYTSDDFNEESKVAMAEPIEGLKRYSAHELIAKMRTW